jgi:lipopolysaccharide assembly outer membrane protein LptD (OstA)
MLRIILLAFCVPFILLGNSLQNEPNVEILAKNVTTKQSVTIAQEDVVAVSLNFYIVAQKMIYDQNKQTLEFFDDVSIVRQT